MIHWKHAELAIELAKKLKESGIGFHLNMVGNGPMAEQLKASVCDFDLTDEVSFLGVLNTEETRDMMERSQIMIATSDHNEGWGAVINEGMASGCAVVASHLMGSVPYLIQNGVNGSVFESGNADDLFIKVKDLLEDKSLCKKISENAYNTISNNWNGEVAANRLAELFRHYKQGDINFAYENDICSHAQILKNDWIKQ